MANINVNEVINTAKNVSQIAANLTKQHEKPQEKKEENFNQPHTQTVEVKVGEQNPASVKPMIIKEKQPVVHEHKVFPDNRELSQRECEVRELEVKQDHEYRMKALDYRMQMEEQARRDRKEREEKYEKERERRRERDRRVARTCGIVVGTACLCAVGYVAYSLYTDYHNPANRRVAISSTEAVNAVPAEGSVT